MDVRSVLKAYKEGEIDESEAERMLRMDYLVSIGSDVVFDMSRELRRGIPEVVYAFSKTPEVVAKIASNANGIMIISKAKREHLEAIAEAVPEAKIMFEYGLAVIGEMPEKTNGKIAVITAGTSDVPVAMEAKTVAEAMCVECLTFFDVGVAGIHRLIGPMKEIIDSGVSAIVVCAGMEGALPTVVSSLSDVPVIGVPISSGYGKGGDGEAALLSMLQTCSLGLTVVNIDNGIGAGTTAALIAKNGKKR